MSDAKPSVLTVDYDGVPTNLQDREQWVAWRLTYDDDRNEWTKVPVDVHSGGLASTTDPETWATFTDVVDYHDRPDTDTDGIGFVFADDGLTVGIDLDDCRDPDTGEIDAWATDIVNTVGTYWEVSPSGTGLHGLVFGLLPDGKTRADIPESDGHIEMYDSGRYFTVTGHRIDQSTADVLQANDAVADVHAEYIAEDNNDGADQPQATTDGGVAAVSGGVTPGVDGQETGSLSDQEVIERAKSADNGHKFKRLWNGRTSGYPSHSEADLALCGLLAFWTGGDRQQIDRLFRQSGLYREKWDNQRGNATYGELTIDKALSGRSEYYDPDSDTANVMDTTRENAPAADTDAGVTWADVIDLFQSNTNGTTTRGYNKAVDLLTAEQDFVTIRETGEMYFYDEERGYYVRKGETYLKERLKAAIPNHVNNNRWRNIRDLAKTATYIDSEEFTPPVGKVCVQNGVLDLNSRTLEPHTPDYYFTAALQTPYDPDATADRWPEFLAESVDQEEADKLEEFIGYCLEAWHHNREKNLFIVGPRQSGKSTFLHVLQALFGSTPTVSNLTPQQIADTRFDAASLQEAMLNAVNDINATKIQDSGTLKRIFSGERLKLERKHQDAHFGAPKAKHAFTANWLPSVVGQDESLFRRVLIVEFPNKIDDADRDERLKLKLAGGSAADGTEYDGELSGILNRALDARERLHEQNGFTNDRDDRATRRKWDSWRDAHKRFLYTQFEITGDSDDKVAKGAYYQAYKEFAGREGYELKPKQGVTKSLQWVPEIGVHDDTYSGIAWRETDAADQSTPERETDSQEDRISTIRSWVDQFTTPLESADRQQIIAYAEQQDYDPDVIEDTIDLMLTKGELIQHDGKLIRGDQ